MQRQNTWDHLLNHHSEATLWHVFSTRQISAAEAEKDCIKGKKRHTNRAKQTRVCAESSPSSARKKDSPHCSEPETSHLRARPGFPAGRLLCPGGELGSI